MRKPVFLLLERCDVFLGFLFVFFQFSLFFFFFFFFLKVALWLGANVMLEYTLEEAEAFLTKTEADARESLDQCIQDLRYLDDQRNTLEVNINRMHNHSLNKRRRIREQQMAQQIAMMQQQQLQQQTKNE